MMRRSGPVRTGITCVVWALGAAAACGSAAWAALPTSPAPGRSDASAASDERWSPQADTVFRHLPSVELQYANVLVQDTTGFVWSGTEPGLVRWDGYRTKTYTADPKNPSAIPAGGVRAVLPDAHGGLWVGTSVGGLAHYDPRTDAFVAYGRGADGLQDSSVTAIVADGHGGLWVGTSTGLDHLDPDTGKVTHAQLDTDHPLAVSALAQEPDGGVWLGTEQGLFHRTAGDARFRAVPLGNPPGRPWPVRTLCRDRAGRLWIGTHSSGLLVKEPGGPTFRAVRLTDDASAPTAPTASEGSRVNAIVDAGRAGVWVSLLGEGMAVVEPDAGWRVRRVRHEIGIASSLLDDDIRSLYFASDGMLWASTTLGLSRHDTRPDGVWTLVGAKSPDRPIPATQVPAVMAHPDGHIWLSLGNRSGAVVLDERGRRFAELRPDATRPRTALPTGMVSAMVTVRGSVVVGTTEGLYLTDARARHVSRIEVPQRAADATVHAMTVVGDTLWVGGTDGLWAIGMERPESPRLITHVPAERVGNRRVTALLQGDGDVLWVGTESGLNRLHTTTGLVEAIHTDAADPAAFSPGYVASLLFDAHHRLWVASMSVGVQVLVQDGEAGSPMRFKHIGERDGLPSPDVNVLLTDVRGRIWASTDGGLVMFDEGSFTTRTLGEGAGVAITQYWAGAGTRTAYGELVFGGIGGITVVQPERHQPERAPPPLVVTETTVGGRVLDGSQFNGPNAKHQIVIQSGSRDLSVEFAALDYSMAERNRYSYRLEGYDKDWIATVSGRRLASYTNLPPGGYRLQLRGSGPEAPWTPTTLSFEVRVVPAWYQAAWFYLAMALLGGFSLVGLVQVRTSILRRREGELHALVELRTRELQSSQRQLEQIAYSDPLTGLANRRRFNEDFRGLVELASRGTVQMTLLLIDLDRFKHVNDTLGHAVGDALLIEVAKRLGGVVRQGDRVARLGGDEFAVVMLGTDDGSDVAQACDRIIDSLGQPFEHDGRTMQVGASIGVASCPRHALNTDALYKSADIALYEAKRAGRNTWRVRADIDEGEVAALG